MPVEGDTRKAAPNERPSQKLWRASAARLMYAVAVEADVIEGWICACVWVWT